MNMATKLSDISKIINKQREFFNTGQTKELKFRKEQLKKLYFVIKENEKIILKSLEKDLKKSHEEGYLTEIGYIYQELKLAIKKLKKWNKPKKYKNASFLPFSKNYTIKEPYGVTLHIAPWNYPFQLTLASVIGAMAAGNTCMIKPSEISNNTAHTINKIISKNFNKKYLAVIKGGITVSQKLLEHRFDYIFYTGNEIVGSIVMQAAAKNLTPITLELGGKSPTIVHEDANLKKAAKRIIYGKGLNSGQTCVAPDYVLIHEKIKEKFLDYVENAIIDFYGEDVRKSKYYARMINNKHFERVSNYMTQGDIIIGGKTKQEERFITPTIIENMDLDSNLMKEEIFGPIIPLITYSDIEQAIDIINDKSKPLALYIFTKNKKIQTNIIQETSSGGIAINDAVVQVANSHIPFGGVGNSGMGRYHGKSSFDLFSNEKTILKQTNLFDLPFRYPPFNKLKMTIIKKFL